MAEEWRAVVGYEGLYEVSDCGGVRSLTRRVRVAYGATRSVAGRTLVQGCHAGGYRVVLLQRDNASKGFLVHRLVVMAFLGPIPAGSEVNHRDGDKTNNVVDNLEVVTRQGNIDHAVANGLIDNKGEANARARLTCEQVQEIRAIHAAGGLGYRPIARRFGVPWGTVRNVIKRRTWAHLAP